MIQYRENPPPPRLKGWVECIWVLRSDGPVPGPHRHLVLPDGCSDLIFNLGDPPGEGVAHRSLRSYLVGTMTRAMDVELLGEVDLIGVRFTGGGAARVLGVPARELTDAVAPLGDLWDRAPELEDALAHAEPGRRAEALTTRLERHLERNPIAPEPRVARALRALWASDGRVSVGRLAAEARVGQRQLERLFARHVGVPPKVLARVARLQRLTEILRSPSAPGLATAAARAGFADQSHMARDVRAFTGLTPTQLLARWD